MNGPSIVRIARTTLAGWQRYKNHPDRRVRDRITWEAHELATTYTAAVAAAARYLHKQTQLVKRLRALLAQFKREFGWKARLAALFGGPYVDYCLRREQSPAWRTATSSNRRQSLKSTSR